MCCNEATVTMTKVEMKVRWDGRMAKLKEVSMLMWVDQMAKSTSLVTQATKDGWDRRMSGSMT